MITTKVKVDEEIKILLMTIELPPAAVATLNRSLARIQELEKELQEINYQGDLSE